MITKTKKNFKELLSDIKAFAFDIDGVLTNGDIYLFDNDTVARVLNSRDGYALQQAVVNRFPIAIISGGSSEPVKKRLNKLGVQDVYLKATDKLDCLKEFKSIYNLEHNEILYMGDDLPDYEVMTRCGIPCCPKDAATEIKELSIYISDKNGGEGCVRDVIEQTLRVQKKWFQTKK